MSTPIVAAPVVEDTVLADLPTLETGERVLVTREHTLDNDGVNHEISLALPGSDGETVRLTPALARELGAALLGGVA